MLLQNDIIGGVNDKKREREKNWKKKKIADTFGFCLPGTSSTRKGGVAYEGAIPMSPSFPPRRLTQFSFDFGQTTRIRRYGRRTNTKNRCLFFQSCVFFGVSNLGSRKS